MVERDEIRSNSIYLLFELFSSFRARSTVMLLLLDGRKTDFENRENCHVRERVSNGRINR